MLKPWAEILRDYIFMVGSLGTVVSFVRTQIRLYRTLKLDDENSQTSRKMKRTPTPKAQPKKEKFSTKLKRCLRAYKITLLIIFISGLVIALLYIIGRSDTPKRDELPAPTPTPVAVLIPPTINSIEDMWLDELEPILHKPRAFFYHEWSRYDLIQIEDTIYHHSIGICIPSKELKEYCNDGSSEEILHDEYIEYRLSYKYKSFQFDYGIDDISFPDDVETASRCEYKIVVQSCNSKEYLGSKDNILYDSDWINYRSMIYRSTQVDVSNCENIRITVYWKFYLRSCEPIVFNIAIINPILRGKKIAPYVSEPTHTKPDSIR